MVLCCGIRSILFTHVHIYVYICATEAIEFKGTTYQVNPMHPSRDKYNGRTSDKIQTIMSLDRLRVLVVGQNVG